MGQLVPNDLHTGKKSNIRAQIDQTKEVSHCVTIKVCLECAGETSVVDRQGPFCSFQIIIIFFSPSRA